MLLTDNNPKAFLDLEIEPPCKVYQTQNINSRSASPIQMDFPSDNFHDLRRILLLRTNH